MSEEGPRERAGIRAEAESGLPIPLGIVIAQRPSNLTGCSNSEPVKHEMRTPREADLRDSWECRAGRISAKANVGIKNSGQVGVELPGVREDGMSGQRKPGTTRGSPRRSRTAKTARISRRAVKS